MVEKAKNLLSTLASKIPNISGGSVKVILALSAVYLFIILLFVAGWLFNWHVDNKADLQTLIAFFRELTNPAALAVFGFIAKGFVDNNKNGVPDSMEEEHDE